MRLIYLVVMLIPFSVLAKTVHVNFDYEMPKNVNSLKYDFILKNEARKQALGKIDAGIFVGKRTLTNGMLSEQITKLTPLVLSVDNFSYSQDANNNFRVQADVNYKYDDIKQLADSLAGIDKLKTDNAALKNAIHEIETKLLSLRYKNIEALKIKPLGDKKTKGKEAVFYIDTTSGMKFVNYTDDELKDIARFYARIVQDYFISEINYIQPVLDVIDNKYSNSWHDEALVQLTWGFDVDMLMFEQKYKKYFDVGHITHRVKNKRNRSELDGNCRSPIIIKFKRGNYFYKCEMSFWSYIDPFANKNKVQEISFSQIKPKLKYATTTTIQKLQRYFDERIKDQMVKLYNEVEDSNYWAKHIVRYTFAIKDSYFISHYRALIVDDYSRGKVLPTYKKFEVKSFVTPFYIPRDVVF